MSPLQKSEHEFIFIIYLWKFTGNLWKYMFNRRKKAFLFLLNEKGIMILCKVVAM